MWHMQHSISGWTQAEPSNPIGVSHMVITHLEQQGFASASGEEYHRYKKNHP
jgi:hypothetical protein